MSDHTLIALSREVAALTVERDRLQQENKELKAFIESGHAGLIADNDRLVAKVQALEAAASWQPIATAPKDGTPVLVFDEGAICLASRDENSGTWFEYGDPMFPSPTQWRPLPAPPAASRHEEEPT